MKTPDNHNMFHTLVHGMNMGLMAIDHEFRITLWNQWLENHCQLDSSKVVGQDLREIFPEIRERKKEESLLHALQQTIPIILSSQFHDYLIHIPLSRDCCSVMLQNVRLLPFTDENNKVSLFIIIEDVTEKEQAKEEILAPSKFPSENPGPVLRLEKDGKVLYRNGAAEEVLKLLAEATESRRTLLSVVEDQQRAEEKIRKLNDELEQRVIARTAQLETANKELEAFSYSVSHDLRAPLRHVNGFVNLLLKREKEHLDATSARYLDMIEQSADRMGQLIDDLLAFSRTGRAEIHRKSVNSNNLIREIIELMSPITKDRHLVWEIGDLPAIKADGSLLRQVWQNLIDNAIKYTAPREEPCIEIGFIPESSGEGRNGPAFFIRDNGVGFDPQYTHKLFGVFQRLHRNDEFEGTGIGLATVRRIVHRHGGRVWAEGVIDQGATFYFTLSGMKG